MRFLLKLIASAVFAYALSLFVTIWANPEVRFWRDVQLQRQSEIEEARKADSQRPLILFTGGSSTAFSVDPALVEESCGLPAFNLALPIAAGPRYLLHQALEQTRSGDILVIGLEADILAYPSDFPAGMFSFGLAVLQGQPSATVGSGSFEAGLAPRDLLNLARPGARYLLTLAYRSLSGKGYRYTPADYRYHGRLETQVQDPEMLTHDVLAGRGLSDSGRSLLLEFREAASRRGVRLYYAMPLRWTSTGNAEISRASNEVLLRSIDPIVPVIDDGTRGVSTERAHFSDSFQHLTAEGSQARSRALAGKLRDLIGKE